MRLSPRQHGFSLVEVTVAAAILLLTCVAVTLVITQAQRAEAQLVAYARLNAVLAAERQRLTALPYFVSPARPEVQPAPGSEPSCLVAAVFPHALPALNNETAFYCAEASQGPRGAFVAVASVGGVTLRSTARFMRATADGYTPLPPERVDAWVAWGSAPPPAASLAITLTAAEGGREISVELLLDALRPLVEPSPIAGIGGSGGA